GIKAPENIPQAEALAKALGAEIAASRPICDEGWLPMERQIGSSGQTVAPKLYLALGISGAIQHVVGMKGARTIVAINKDSNAPIFEIADYGVVGDIFEIMPALTEACTYKWYNQTLCQVNGSVVRLGVVLGEYHWHKHDDDDEFFYVVEGKLLIDLESRTMELGPRQGAVVPKGVLHRTRAPQRTVMLMVENAGIIPTGN